MLIFYFGELGSYARKQTTINDELLIGYRFTALVQIIPNCDEIQNDSLTPD